MGDQFDDSWLESSFDEGEDEFASTDPFDGLTKRDQDIFFKVLDMVPDDKREIAMDYFLDHPAKIRAVIAGVRLQKKLIQEKNVAGLNQLFEKEHVAFQSADDMVAVAKDDDESWG